MNSIDSILVEVLQITHSIHVVNFTSNYGR